MGGRGREARVSMLEGTLVPGVAILTTSSIRELDPHMCCPMRLVHVIPISQTGKLRQQGCVMLESHRWGEGEAGCTPGTGVRAAATASHRPPAARRLQAAPRPQALGCLRPSRSSVTPVPPQSCTQAEVRRGWRHGGCWLSHGRGGGGGAGTWAPWRR